MPFSIVSTETLLFLAQHVRHARLRIGEFGIRAAHLRDEIGDELVEERPLAAELVAVADSAPHDPAQHVAAALVAGDHAVDDEERAGADVVRNDLQRIVREIGNVSLARRGLDERLEQIDFVVAVHVLQHGRDPLEAHAGIDARLGQRRHVALTRRG